MNLYWSLSEPILVTERTYIGRRVNLYWSAREPIVVGARTNIGSHPYPILTQTIPRYWMAYNYRQVYAVSKSVNYHQPLHSLKEQAL